MIPPQNDFILSINADYDFRDFVQNYLWNANPGSNIYRYSQRVGYTLSDNGAPGPSGPVAPTATPQPVPSPYSTPSSSAYPRIFPYLRIYTDSRILATIRSSIRNQLEFGGWWCY